MRKIKKINLNLKDLLLEKPSNYFNICDDSVYYEFKINSEYFGILPLEVHFFPSKKEWTKLKNSG